MPRHSTSVRHASSSGGALLHKSHSMFGSGLRPRHHPATYADSVGLVGSGISRSGGFGTKVGAVRNRWIEHVQKYAAAHGVSYGVALKGAKASYHKA